MSRFRAGLLALVVLAVGSYFGFTRANPFSSPFELQAVFRTANNLKPNSPVRIAGVEVGKVKRIEPIVGGGARVDMELTDQALPIHEDAELKVRPRIFLEGNFFVDVRPGSPSAPVVEDGDTIPINQTAAPVQFGDVLASLQSDTREDLKTLLKEYSKGLSGGGAAGFNRSIRYWEPAYRSSALANDATLGEEPTRDLGRVLRGQQRTFAALVEDERALKDLVTSFNVAAGAFAREDEALRAAVPALRDTLRVARPALRSLNDALPSLRAFAREALPGVRSSGPTLRRSLPFIRQARALVTRRELRGLAAQLRLQTPRLFAFNEQTVGLLGEGRQLSACTNEVLVPFLGLRMSDPDFPDVDGKPVRESIQHTWPGLAGESRLSDANNQWFHTSAVPPGTRVRPGPPPDGGSQPPPHRPDVPCELQELPDLRAPGGPSTAFPVLETTAGSSRVKPQRPVSRERMRRALAEFQETALPKIERIRARYRAKERRAREGRR